MKPIITALLAAAALTVHATEATPWSLDSCIAYASSHNLTVRARQLSVASAEIDVTDARDRYLPTASAGMSQNFDFGRGLTSANTYADRNTRSMGWNVGVQLPLFQGLSSWRNEQVARASLSQVLEQVEAAREDVTLNVISAYLQALYNRELCHIAAEQCRISAIEVDRRQTLLDNGKIAALELTQARATLAADTLTLVTAQHDRDMALVDLALLLRISPETPFSIATVDTAATIIPDIETVYQNALLHNHALTASRMSIDVASRRIDLARTGYLPRLSFNLGLGSTYYHLNGEQNPSFSRQMRDNYSTSLGFTLSVPLFDAFSTRNSINRARVARQEAELQYETDCDNVYRAISTAYHQARGAQARLASAQVASQATHAAFEAMQEKYNFGRANATEFETAKSEYIRALGQELQARFELILRARILQFYNRN